MSLPPFTLAGPDHCSWAGTFFWMVGSQTVSYKLRCGALVSHVQRRRTCCNTYLSPPSSALLPGSKLPRWWESVQHGLLVPQNGPAAYPDTSAWGEFHTRQGEKGGG